MKGQQMNDSLIRCSVALQVFPPFTAETLSVTLNNNKDSDLWETALLQTHMELTHMFV